MPRFKGIPVEEEKKPRFNGAPLDVPAIPEVPKEALGKRVPSGFEVGLMDPIHGVAQAIPKIMSAVEIVPGSGALAERGINYINNLLASKGMPLATIPPEGVGQQIQEAEAKYQEAREPGIDWGRIAGNVLSPAYWAPTRLVGPAATMGERVMQGAALGGMFGGMQPVTEGDFAEEKAKQVGLGATLGGSLPIVTGGISRMISPKPSEAVRKMGEEGIPLTIGQRLGGIAKTAEERMTGVPGTGYLIQKSREEGYKAFNEAAINRALKPIDKKIPKGLDIHDAITYTRKTLGDAYKSLLNKMTGRIDDTFTKDFNNITSKVEGSLPDNLADVFKKRISYETLKRVSKDGRISGENLKSIQEGLRNNAEKFSKSSDGFQRELGEAFSDTLDAFNKMLSRNNPKYAEELNKVNTGYANFKRVQRAASTVGVSEGMITPSQLHAAVRALDKSKDKRAFAERTALMQDLSRYAKEALPSKTPTSGTSERLLMTNPIIGGLSALSTLPIAPFYTRTGNLLAQNLLTYNRPDLAKQIAEIVRQSPQYLTPGAVAGGYGLLGNGR